ncbi:8-amino-7-oxononanoate synthase [Ramlibacter sp. AW1]|uniref:8-amino-7-oxononanoate synthase n=1 Tax=Ramlibacter aurantiacus TaxID=2801330 RepID=A0A937D7A8_9BURK|nr:8-amino-7-oxononanoate synthase [Ramlibacter aurantiacus]MBL0420741.1 8-amino-7-oxononanoate synthase [Ramlibacter aurantiacus]
MSAGADTLLEPLRQRLAAIEAAGLRRRRVAAESPCAPRMRMQGQDRLCFNSNDYLGLANDPRVVAALAEGARLHGAGSGASHLVSGHSRAHAALEDRLADWYAPYLPHPRALFFCTGYMANLAVIGALADIDRAGCEVFSEALNHASLIDGIRLARVPTTVYPHRDTQALAQALSASRARHKIVVTDAVFSMDGDVAPLRELAALCERHGAWLVVDDAHGFGVLGARGRGVLEDLDLHCGHLVLVGTLGKAAGVAGAFVAAHAEVIDWLVQRARTYIYTTASPPAIAHALQTSLDIIESGEGALRRQHLQDLIGRFRAMPVPGGWRRLPSATAIQPVLVGDNTRVLAAAAALQAQGLWVTAIRAPTVPEGTARLRITLCALHQPEQIDRLGQALAGVSR